MPNVWSLSVGPPSRRTISSVEYVLSYSVTAMLTVVSISAAEVVKLVVFVAVLWAKASVGLLMVATAMPVRLACLSIFMAAVPVAVNESCLVARLKATPRFLFE